MDGRKDSKKKLFGGTMHAKASSMHWGKKILQCVGIVAE